MIINDARTLSPSALGEEVFVSVKLLHPDIANATSAANMIKWGYTQLALLFLSPISLLSASFLIFNCFGTYYSETATPKSTTHSLAAWHGETRLFAGPILRDLLTIPQRLYLALEGEMRRLLGVVRREQHGLKVAVLNKRILQVLALAKVEGVKQVQVLFDIVSQHQAIDRAARTFCVFDKTLLNEELRSRLDAETLLASKPPYAGEALAPLRPKPNLFLAEEREKNSP